MDGGGHPPVVTGVWCIDWVKCSMLWEICVPVIGLKHAVQKYYRRKTWSHDLRLIASNFYLRLKMFNVEFEFLHKPMISDVASVQIKSPSAKAPSLRTHAHLSRTGNSHFLQVKQLIYESANKLTERLLNVTK